MKAPADKPSADIPLSGIHPVDRIPPASRLWILGLQHVLVMYAGGVAVPLIVGHALGLAPADIAFLVSADLFASGLATLVQSCGLKGVGIRLPVMMGVTFASVTPMLAMISAGVTKGVAASGTLTLIYGSVIAAGMFGFLVAPFVARLARYFPPIVTGTTILTIGISLLGIGIDWAGGGQSSDPSYGAPIHLGMALLVLVFILALAKWAKGFFSAIAVLLGVAAGSMLAAAVGLMDFSTVAVAPWFGLVLPFHFGVPVFSPIPIVTMCIVMIVVMVESFGMFLAVGEMTKRPPDRAAITRGLRGDALGTIIGGVFNTFPYTSFSQNVGLVGVTGVSSRFVCAAAGAIMLVLGLSPKVAALVGAVPLFVLGGAGFVLFGMVAATGIQILGKVDFAGNRNNLLIAAISLSIGMIPLLAGKFFQFMPHALDPILGSGVLLATLTALVLNAYFNGGGASAPAKP